MKMDFPVALFLFFSVMPSTLCQVVVHYTSSGGVCGDTCGYHGYGYTWCHQKGGNGKAWDYCSLEEGLEASGKACASSCDFWGGSYRYCYLKSGGWNYCGLLGLQDFISYAQDDSICLNPCRESNGYFQCNTIKGSQRCSPFRDVTPSGLPCHHYYRCSKYGHSVYRCLLEDDEDKWDHCGLNSLNKCIWALNESNSSQIESCTLPYFEKEGKIIFRRERSERMYPPTKEEFKNAVHLIDEIYSVTKFPVPEPRAIVHLYRQEDILCKGINYTSVELEVGDPKASVQPIAHVIYPHSLKSAEILRLAFYTSLHSTFYSPAYTIAVSVDEAMPCTIHHQ